MAGSLAVLAALRAAAPACLAPRPAGAGTVLAVDLRQKLAALEASAPSPVFGCSTIDKFCKICKLLL